MTNPSNAVGTNGAYGGRTSVDALNDVLGAFSGPGVLEGWNVRANSGMTVMAGGQSGIRDVAIAQDQLGDRTTVNNRLGSPVNITLSAASSSTARVDSIVLYVNKPASVSTTTIDNPGACGIIAVNGTTSAPSDADIRSAITADGGTGATAYFVVIADITIPASATVITNSNIKNYSKGLLNSPMLNWSTMEKWAINLAGNPSVSQAGAYNYVDIPDSTINFTATVGGVYLAIVGGAVSCQSASTDCYLRLVINGTAICSALSQNAQAGKYTAVFSAQIFTATQASNTAKLTLGGGQANATYNIAGGTISGATIFRIA